MKKVLFFVPKRYSLFQIFRDVFASRGCEIREVDHFDIISIGMRRLNAQMFRLPSRLRRRWEGYYSQKINAYYLDEYERFRPDLVFVYNSEMILPETLARFRQKSKVAFFMGDHPFYTPTNRYYLSLLFNADALFVPDTFWMAQLAKMGADNMHYLPPCLPTKVYHPVALSESERAAYQTEVLYVGMNYVDSWGYKKAKFMDNFCGFDLQIHGNKHWRKWFDFFPRLAEHFQEQTSLYPIEEMNKRYNATKIVPVDGNPGLLHGIHLRMYEALAAGALPLLEWQGDLPLLFGADIELPAVKDYRAIPEMASYYLRHEAERKALVERMRDAVQSRFSSERIADIIFEALQMRSHFGQWTPAQ